MTRKQLPLLAGIAGLIRWVEELANLVSGPLLTLGLGIALVDLLTDGSLLTRYQLLLYVWAVTQAIGVDAQLVATWDRAREALREHRYWALFALVILGGVLAYVAWVAAQVFALQQSEGLTTRAALARLGFDSAIWLVQRTALSVFLVCLAGWTRYHEPAADVAGAAEAERERLQAELMLEPLRAQKRALQVNGLRRVGLAAMGKDAPPLVTPPRPPTGGGSPTQKQPAQTGVITPATNITPLRPPSRTPSRRKRGTSTRVARASVETKARRHYRPGMSASELARVAHIGKSAASKYARLLSAEQTAL